MMDLLSAYEGALGQKVNKEKTAIFFSKVVNEASRQLIKGILIVEASFTSWEEKKKLALPT